jgi:hypothetical protein
LFFVFPGIAPYIVYVVGCLVSLVPVYV